MRNQRPCGRCGEYHATAEAVRACYNGPVPTVDRAGNGRDRPTDKQLAYARTLLDRAGKREGVDTDRLETYTRWGISTLIDKLKQEGQGG